MSSKRPCGRPAAPRSPMCILPCLKTTAKSASAARTTLDARRRGQAVAIQFRRYELLSCVPAARAGLARARAPLADLAANSGLLGHLATPASTTRSLHADRLSRAQGQGHLAW